MGGQVPLGTDPGQPWKRMLSLLLPAFPEDLLLLAGECELGERNNESVRGPLDSGSEPIPTPGDPSLPGEPPFRWSPGGQGVGAAAAQVCPHQAHQKAELEDKSSAAGRVLTSVP